MQRWVNIVETNCDPAREEEFNHWCNDIHMPDVLKTPGFVRARRYLNKEFRDGRGKYMQVYDIETDNIEKSMQLRLEMRAKEAGQGRASKNHPNLSFPLWFDVCFMEIFERKALQNSTSKTGRWLNLVEYNVDPTREVEHRSWHDTIHIPDVLRTPGFVSARCYQIKDARDGRGKYMSIYEIETDDIDNTMKVRLETRAEELKQGRGSGNRPHLVRPVWRDVLWKQIFHLSA